MLRLLFLCAAGSAIAAPAPKTVSQKAAFTAGDEDLQKLDAANNYPGALTDFTATLVLGIKYESVKKPDQQPTPHYPEVPAQPVIAELSPPDEEQIVDCAKEKCVALTFDDGPSPEHTPKLLDILAKE